MIKAILFSLLITFTTVQAKRYTALPKPATQDLNLSNITKNDTGLPKLRSMFPNGGVYIGQWLDKADDITIIPSKEPFFQIIYASKKKPSHDNIVIYFSPSCAHCYDHLKDGTFANIARNAAQGKYNIYYRILEMTPLDPFIVAVCMQGGDRQFMPNMRNFLSKMYEKNLWSFFQTSDKAKKKQIVQSVESSLRPEQLQRLSKDLGIRLIEIVALSVGLDPTHTKKAKEYLKYIQNSRNPEIKIEAIPIVFKNGKEIPFKNILGGKSKKVKKMLPVKH